MRQFQALTAILNQISRVSVAIVGDFCIDAYWEIDTRAKELSLETGKPTVAIRRQRYSLGGAGNVGKNLVALGVRRTFALGVTTDDVYGREMMRQMRSLKIHIGGLVGQSKEWETPGYAKPYRGSVEQSRIDFGRFNSVSGNSEKKLIATLRDEVSKVDAVIVNQQLPQSIFTRTVIRALNDLAEKYPEKIFLVDSRHRIPDFRSMICKLNAVEAAALFGRNVRHNELIGTTQLCRHAEHFFKQFRKPVFITRGRLGLLLFDDNGAQEIPALKVDGVIDPVGAGDTVVATLAASLAAGATPVQAGKLAMIAAAITVRKLRQTGSASPKEILHVATHLR
ncbi:MAG: PfkB family carbohydrate kinase [Ignavibacteriales bacterium]|nr:PfkB family carbohydrate kinase [Ignavibacteriales bacterium]